MAPNDHSQKRSLGFSSSMKTMHQFWVVVGLLVSTFLCASILFCLRRPPPPPAHPLDRAPSYTITLNDGTLAFHLDPKIYQDFFPHLQGYQCRELISPDALCQGGPPSGGAPLLLLAVKSHPAASDRRAALRRTWARPGQVGGFRLQPLFLVAATPDVRHTRLVQEESRAFADLVIWDFEESHHNLTLKERCFLRWAHVHCPQAAYVFKGDDDLFVNIEALTEYLRQTPNASDFIHGNIQYHSAVMREGKYAVSSALYPMAQYPTFASGGGFVMPRDSLSGLYRVSLWLPVFPLDDVYLGFLALAAGLSHRHEGRFRVWGPPKDELEVYRESLTVHGLSMERMEQVWKALHSPSRGKA
nr:UDP-GlcNAc:betaGal beta-1,3-N-acetylglucosaminyltransferase 9-like isoform X1 [Pogona vitticeps]